MPNTRDPDWLARVDGASKEHHETAGPVTQKVPMAKTYNYDFF